MRHGVNAAVLEPEQRYREEVRVLGEAMRAVAIEQRRMGAVQRQAIPVHDRERRAGVGP